MNQSGCRDRRRSLRLTTFVFAVSSMLLAGCGSESANERVDESTNESRSSSTTMLSREPGPEPTTNSTTSTSVTVQTAPSTTALPASTVPPSPSFEFAVDCPEVERRTYGLQEALPYTDSLSFALASDGGLWATDDATNTEFFVVYPDQGTQVQFKSVPRDMGNQVLERAVAGGVANSYVRSAHATAGAMCADLYEPGYGTFEWEDAGGVFGD